MLCLFTWLETCLLVSIVSQLVLWIKLQKLIPVWLSCVEVLLVVGIDEAHILVRCLQVAEFIFITLLCFQLIDYFCISSNSLVVQLVLESSVTLLKLAEIYVNKAKKDPAKKVENIDKAIGVYAKLAEKYPTLKPFAKLQEGNTAFQNELDDKAIAAYTEVINELEAKQCDEDELSYLKTSYQYMGFIYTYDKQDFNTAKPYWDKLLKLDPQNKLANDAYEKAGLKPGE
jgi:tetratricopeptide (TPR) repeat protein